MVRAVQQLSGLRIDHYLGVDLRAAARHGRRPRRGPDLRRALAGDRRRGRCRPRRARRSCRARAATGFLRPGDTGSDVTGAAVAERAQRLLTSTLRAAMSTSTLADPVRLTRFLTRAADALTVDDQTTLGDLRALAGSLGDLSGTRWSAPSLPVAQVGYVPAGTDQAVRPARRGRRPGRCSTPSSTARRCPKRLPRRRGAPPRTAGAEAPAAARRAEPAPAAAPATQAPDRRAVRGHARRAQRHRDDGPGRHGRRSAARRGLHGAARSATSPGR